MKFTMYISKTTFDKIVDKVRSEMYWAVDDFLKGEKFKDKTRLREILRKYIRFVDSFIVLAALEPLAITYTEGEDEQLK